MIQLSNPTERSLRRVKLLLNMFACCLGSLLLTGCNTSNHDDVSFTVCPDGRSIVFAAADGDLHRLRLDTHEVSDVLTGPGPSTMPTISPDGKDVVYVAPASGRQGTSIFSRPLDGSRPAKQLTNVPSVADSLPTFASDGRIAFLRALKHRERSMGGWTWEDFDIYIMASDGSAPRRVGTQTFSRVNRLCFVDGGKRLILGGYNIGPNSRFSLYAGDASGTGEFERIATPDRPDPKSAAWGSEPSASLDGDKIVAVSDRATAFEYDIVLMKSDGSPIRSLGVTKISHYNQNPVLMPDGQSILFLSGEEGFGSSSKPKFSLWQVNIDGSSPHKIAGTQLFSNP